MKINFKISILIIISIFLFACNNSNVELEENNNTNLKTIPEWMNISFVDVKTNEVYKLSDFSRPVLLESFAVWCPTCTRQQNVIKELHEDIGQKVVSIALDTDPNENKETVIDHMQKNGFDWIYSISPSELTNSLIDEFGLGIVNAPTVPMILICPDGSYEQLKSGVKNIAYLNQKIDGCFNALN